MWVSDETVRDFEAFILRDAETGDSQSQFVAYKLLQNKNKPTAFLYLYKAACQAHQGAMDRLSNMYYNNGDCVEGAKWALATKYEPVILNRIRQSTNPAELYIFGKVLYSNVALRANFVFAQIECTFEFYTRTRNKVRKALTTWFLICPFCEDVRVIIAKMILATKEDPSVWLPQTEIAEILKLK